MKTIVFGASPNSYRYSYSATLMLQESGFEVIPMGIHLGQIGGQDILDLNQMPSLPDIDTITMYLNPDNQKQWYRYILDLKPRRVVFNPGSENPEFCKLLASAKIDVEEACTLVMLSTGSFAQ